MESKVHQALSDIFFGDSRTFLENSTIDYKLVSNATLISAEHYFKVIFEFLSDVVCVKDSYLGGLQQAFLAK